jgi:hypothetical protein
MEASMRNPGGDNGSGNDIEITLDDYYRTWETSVRIANGFSPEKRAALRAAFQAASEKAQAIMDGLLEPLSVWVPSVRVEIQVDEPKEHAGD